MDETEQLAACGRGLAQVLLASYGLRSEDLQAEVRTACRHMGGQDVVLLLADYDQEVLVGFDDDDVTVLIDAPGPGLAFRTETVVEEGAPGGRRRLWLPVKDSAERIGVLGVVDDGSMPPRLWESMASLIGELVVSKSKYGDHITLRRRRNRPFPLAAEMRWSMLPPLTFTSPDATIAGFLQPSDRIAGDAFDYSVDGRVASVAIFDAMGHGLEASRMANVAVGSYRSTRRAGADLTGSLRALDEAITTQFGDLRFVTAQMATLDLDTGRLEIVNAGHPPPLRLRPGRPPDVIRCEVTLAAGLGSEPVVTVVHLDRGDAVLFQSDGIVEARSPAGEFFGDERLADLIDRLADHDTPPAEVLRRCLHAVIEHQDGRPNDDATLLLLRWTDDARLTTEAGPGTQGRGDST